MGIAKVAIIGRPNVGKSSLFNWLIGERVSVVDAVAGVTRDRVSFLLDLGIDDLSEEERQLLRQAEISATDDDTSEDRGDRSEQGSETAETDDPTADNKNTEASEGVSEPEVPEITRWIELTDTGGIGVVDKDDLSEDVEQQIQFAINTANLILFVVDARAGITPLDEMVAEKLRKLPIPVLLVANKADGEVQEHDAEEFQRFGWGVVKVSAKQKRGRVRLMEEITQNIPLSAFCSGSDVSDPLMKIAVVGRRNVGKSTFVNTLVHEERVIASEVPGTTRDCIDVRFQMGNKSFIVIDTPGFMRKKSYGSDLDFYSVTRAERSIRMADVVLMFFDCSRRISKLDKQLVNLIGKYHKPCIFVVNKWDLMAEHMPTGRWGEYLRDTLRTMWHVPIAFITGLTGKNADKLLQQARTLRRQSRTRVSTNQLNRLITAAMDYNPPPLFHFRKPKIYYVTQVDVNPPTLVLFCNMPDSFTPSYKRYLLNVIRDELPFGEVPVRLLFRKRESDDTNDEVDSKRKGY